MSPFFFGTHTFFEIMFDPEKYEFLYSFLELILFFGAHPFFGTMPDPKKYEFLFCWYSFWHIVWPEKL